MTREEAIKSVKEVYPDWSPESMLEDARHNLELMRGFATEEAAGGQSDADLFIACYQVLAGQFHSKEIDIYRISAVLAAALVESVKRPGEHSTSA